MNIITHRGTFFSSFFETNDSDRSDIDPNELTKKQDINYIEERNYK